MKPYFPKLDSIRFYAFIVVLISHLYFFCYDATESGNQWLSKNGLAIFGHGEIGVHIFFALSGFLIMFLAIREFKTKLKFSIVGFYRRRILRIWPLYFLTLALGFAVATIPSGIDNCLNRFWYFLGNTCMAEGIPENINVVAIGPLWSVSVEEQFYLIFPLLFFTCIWVYKKWRKSGIAIIGTVTVLALVYSFYQRYIREQDWDFVSYASVSVLPSLVLGMILAVMVSLKSEYIGSFVKKNALYLKILVPILFFFSIYMKFTGALGVSLYILTLFACTKILILLSLYGDHAETKISKITRYLGKISYGLYLYHMFVILFINYLFRNIAGDMSDLSIIALKSVLIFGGTVAVAHLSYKYMESWFLKYKNPRV